MTKMSRSIILTTRCENDVWVWVVTAILLQGCGHVAKKICGL